MTDQQRVIHLSRAGLSREAIAAILDTDIETVRGVTLDDGSELPAAGGGGTVAGPWVAFLASGGGAADDGRFMNGWADFGDPYQHCEYRQVGDEVQVRGLGLGPGGSAGDVVAVLPPGLRPTRIEPRLAWSSGPAVLHIRPNGEIAGGTALATDVQFAFSFSTV